VLIIQVAAAVLLLLGSALIFRALLEIDAPTRPNRVIRHRAHPVEPEEDAHLPRAA
jgi:hypothetical protein